MNASAATSKLIKALSWIGVWACTANAQLKINEVYYNVTPQGGNQYVELINTAATNVYLDGLILTDEASFGTEGVFQFPGAPGGTTLPVSPGARIVVAVDATGSTSNAQWECYAGGLDTDNPSVPNLVRVSGVDDLGFFPGGDNCILASGVDTSAPIDQATVLDGMNFGGGGGELAPLSAGASDPAPGITAPVNTSLGRCPDGVDSNTGSAADFLPASITPGAANVCALPNIVISDASVAEGNAGTNLMSFVINLSSASVAQVTVVFATTNGTATAGLDYRAVAATQLVFSAGVTSRVVSVGVFGDTQIEGNEVFFARLTSPVNAIPADDSGQGLILDDDGPLSAFTSNFTRITGPGTAVTTEWTALSGRSYQLQLAPSLAGPAWTNIGGVVTAGSSSASVVDDSGAAVTQRFYRVFQLD